MTFRPDPDVDERYEELVTLLRARKPTASEELRERVRDVAASRTASRRPRLRAPRPLARRARPHVRGGCRGAPGRRARVPRLPDG